ncbi:MAG TPA: hypothetical protein VGG29_12565 [Caulobacteraceae bacterium]|jgi:hypothetical protein
MAWRNVLEHTRAASQRRLRRQRHDDRLRCHAPQDGGVVLGNWGEGASASERFLTTLEYKMLDGRVPTFWFVDAESRPLATSDLVGRALSRAQALASGDRELVLECCDFILASDERVEPLLGNLKISRQFAKLR